jgi:hypothetical protein
LVWLALKLLPNSIVDPVKGEIKIALGKFAALAATIWLLRVDQTQWTFEDRLLSFKA